MMTEENIECEVTCSTTVSAAEEEHSSMNGAKGSTDSENLENNDIFTCYNILESLAKDNIQFLENDLSPKGQRLHGALVGLIDHIKSSKINVKEVVEFCHEYDFDEFTPGNGYRSFIHVVQSAINYSIKVCRNLVQVRSSIFFRKGWYMKEAEACNHLLASLSTCSTYMLTLRSWCEKGELFPTDDKTAEELFESGETINQYCFYGRCLGFQFCDSMKGVLRFISICMAGFSESFYSQAGLIAKTTSSVWTSGKYFLDPELRARRIVNISQNASVDFCKAFWFLAESELMHTIPSVVGSPVKVNNVISIPPEPLQIAHSTSDKFIDIPVPTSHLGTGPISARLLSSKYREGMIGTVGKVRSPLPPSDNLIIHCHGGGFVAQSSKSHELYLRDWATALETPILSIDYSLAPQAPFPRALEEVFYAYCWAQENSALLGSTASKIILVGDSAGANLNIGICLRCVELGIRKPDGLFLAYCPTLVSFVPSPARMLCLMDPLLPFGFMMRCLKAYACPNPEIIEQNKNHVEYSNTIKKANGSYQVYSLDQTVINNNKLLTPTSSRENSTWEALEYDEKNPKSPISDATSDTFASASYHSQTIENTELLTPGNESLCSTFEEDSQPIVISTPPVSEDTQIYDNLNKEINSNEEKDNISGQYISSFLDKYVVDNAVEACEDSRPKIMQSIPQTKSEENILLASGKDLMAGKCFQKQLNKVADNLATAVSSTINKFTTSSEIVGASTPEVQNKFNALIARSPSDEFIFNVPKDPYLSPYWADDEYLRQLPPTKILTIEMDPCLDDCVMFAKKIKRLGVPVNLDVLKGLPHGFLNFSMLSKEANDGSKVCVRRITELLNGTTS